MMMNKNELVSVLIHLNMTAQSRILADNEITEFIKIIDEFEIQKQKIRESLNSINSLKPIEDFNWELEKIRESLDYSDLVIKELAKIYIELDYCVEQVIKLKDMFDKVWLNYTAQDSEPVEPVH